MGRHAITRFLTVVPVLLGGCFTVSGFIHLVPGEPDLPHRLSTEESLHSAPLSTRTSDPDSNSPTYRSHRGEALSGPWPGPPSGVSHPGGHGDPVRRTPRTVVSHALKLARIIHEERVNNPGLSGEGRFLFGARGYMLQGRYHAVSRRAGDADFVPNRWPQGLLLSPHCSRAVFANNAG